MRPAQRWSLIVTLAGFSILGRLALVAVPGVSLSYVVLFIAGVAFGPRVGAGVGLVGRLGSDILLSGLNPIFIPMTLVEVTLGAASGILGVSVDFGQRKKTPMFFAVALLAFLGIVFTLAYSVAADTYTWLFYNLLLPGAADAASGTVWWVLVARGLLFVVPAVVVNAVIFPSVVPPALTALREAGLLEESSRPAAQAA